jgi:hypothetical protein
MKNEILKSLAAAFGGISQVPDALVGAALVGQAVNNFLGNPMEVAASIAEELEEHWELLESPLPAILEGYRAEYARRGLDSTDAPLI